MRTVPCQGPHRTDWTLDVPTSRRERVRGLRDHPGLAPRRGMLFLRCRSVHTFGMTFPIDAVLLDRTYRIVAVIPMPPGRLLLPHTDARHVLECGTGVALRPGDRLIGLNWERPV